MTTVIYIGDRYGRGGNYSSGVEHFVGTLVGCYCAVVVFWACLLVNVRPNLGAFGNYGVFQRF